MKFNKFRSCVLWKDSVTISLALVTALETLLALLDVSMGDLVQCHWYGHLSILVLLFVIVTCGVAYCKTWLADKEVVLKIRGIKVIIKEGDLFKEPDWKLIPFNEFFDTKVDDVVIARNSLNGIFITNYVKDLNQFQKTIDEYPEQSTLKSKTKGGRKCYPLGKIIPYDDFLLLALTHFEDNQAFITHDDYEKCLRTMWQEICRVYANQPIALPLLGSGLTRFKDYAEKKNSNLLRCMLCTLNSSMVQINQPITIILRRETLDEINLYNLKKQF